MENHGTPYHRTRSNHKFLPYAEEITTRDGEFSLESALMTAVVGEAVNAHEDDIQPRQTVTIAPSVEFTSHLATCFSLTNSINSTPGESIGIVNTDKPVVEEEDVSDHMVAHSSKRKRVQKKKAKSHAQRKKLRGESRESVLITPDAHADRSRPNVAARYTNDGPQVQCSAVAENVKVASTGFIGLSDKDDPQATREYTLAEVTGEGSELNFTLKEWDGKTATVITDAGGRIVAVLAGRPEDNDWEAVHRDAADALESQRSQCQFTPEMLSHCRGEFAVLNCGISFGGGQRYPKNLKNHATNQAVVDRLCNMTCFKRIAGFGSAVLRHRAPKVYSHYLANLAKLKLAEATGVVDKEARVLNRPFSNSVFCAATFNFGPRTICFKHKDYGNLAFGWCAVTALGYFDHKQGGHLILWDCGLVIEFPPGATILLPSAVVSHSNVAIQSGERRYSFAQYSSGGLFQWTANGCQTASKCFAAMSTQEKQMRAREDAERWSLGLSLWPRVEKITDPSIHSPEGSTLPVS